MRNFRIGIIIALCLLMVTVVVYKVGEYMDLNKAGQTANTMPPRNSEKEPEAEDDRSIGKNTEEEQETVDNQENKPENKININIDADVLEERFSLPEGFEKIPAEEGSFAAYLRGLPLKPHGSPVKYYDGTIKQRNAHEAVIDIDVGDRDLQQCADAVMRLWAEYLYGKGLYDKIHFNFTNGFNADYSTWRKGNRIVVEGNNSYWVKRNGQSEDYKSFRQYMDMVFAYAGTVSLSQELKSVEVEDMQIGDIFMKGPLPGHCVIVVDMAQNGQTGERLFMLAQSYMPAQDIHILKNEEDTLTSPWYSIDFGETLKTPQWSFSRNQLMRFE
jgi:hypothetical protein